jgi:hypothetical protein
MGLIETLGLGSMVSIVTVLGLPGLVLIFWAVDHRRYEKERAEHKKEIAKILARYDKDMATVTRFYADNVLLVKDYSRLSAELANIIHLNTQVQTRLVEKINNNHFCPIVRQKGPHDD